MDVRTFPSAPGSVCVLTEEVVSYVDKFSDYVDIDVNVNIR